MSIASSYLTGGGLRGVGTPAPPPNLAHQSCCKTIPNLFGVGWGLWHTGYPIEQSRAPHSLQLVIFEYLISGSCYPVRN